jgi:hypothetical protein
MAVAAAIIVIAVLELDSRSDDGGLAIPTLQPEPTRAPSTAAGPTLAPPTSPPPKKTASAAGTPAPSFSRTPEPMPTPEETAAPPRTPTPSPEPTLPVGPIDKSNGPTPHTGGGAVPYGLLIAALTLGLRAAIHVPRRRSS